MDGGTVEIQLPSGGTWIARKRLTWGQKKEINRGALRMLKPKQGITLSGLREGVDVFEVDPAAIDLSVQDDALLLAGTVSWSFPEPVSKEAMDARDALDVEAVLLVIRPLYGYGEAAQVKVEELKKA